MKAFNNISSVHFIGIGGIGMSALARYFKKQEKYVSGYDKTRTNLTDELVAEGIHIYYEDKVEHLDQSAGLVVYTPAIPSNNNILSYYKEHQYTILKRSEALQKITGNYKTIAIAGTHGKTTITALTSWIAHCANLDATSFIGGICNNYNSNFIYGEGEYIIVEADEYDRSFLKLQPHLALISAIDADHLDIYNTYEALREAYIQFGASVQPNGQLVVNSNTSDKIKNNNYSYAVIEHQEENNGQTKPAFYAYDTKVKDGKLTFSLSLDGNEIENIPFNLPGKYNVENATAAAALNFLAGASLENIKSGLASFKGIKRRFEYIINTPALVMIDDYAHHPVELNALIAAAKNLYPNRKISIIFQPHLYSRTKDFAHGFAASLDNADEVILIDIYPARELPIDGISSSVILNKMKNSQKELSNKKNLLEDIRDRDFEVLLMAGAGDIDQLILPVKNLLTTKMQNK